MTSGSLPYPPGVTLTDAGVNVAVYSETADSIDVCLFDHSGSETHDSLSQLSESGPAWLKRNTAILIGRSFTLFRPRTNR